MSENKSSNLSDALYLALSIGESLLVSGAEISRVEDTICRICKAYGAEYVDVFAITSSIVVSIRTGQEVFTQTRRIHETAYNMHKLEQLNQLSRNICSGSTPPDTGEILTKLDKINEDTGCSFLQMIFLYALVSSAFCLFFGGSFRDAAVSAVIGAFLRCLQTGLGRLEMNQFISSFICSITGGILAILFVRSGIGQSSEMISIGNIMLLIPGLAMTNGIRDMFSGNIISGLLRLSEALLLAIIIAFAFVLTSMLV
jgi:uncharacterized membrane protein YjjP (DUF1212 family)